MNLITELYLFRTPYDDDSQSFSKTSRKCSRLNYILVCIFIFLTNPFPKIEHIISTFASGDNHQQQHFFRLGTRISVMFN
jgi:hypothetical protein